MCIEWKAPPPFFHRGPVPSESCCWYPMGMHGSAQISTRSSRVENEALNASNARSELRPIFLIFLANCWHQLSICPFEMLSPWLCLFGAYAKQPRLSLKSSEHFVSQLKPCILDTYLGIEEKRGIYAGPALSLNEFGEGGTALCWQGNMTV